MRAAGLDLLGQDGHAASHGSVKKRRRRGWTELVMRQKRVANPKLKIKCSKTHHTRPAGEMDVCKEIIGESGKVESVCKKILLGLVSVAMEGEFISMFSVT